MTYLWFLTFFLLTSCLAAGESTEYALLGTSYHLIPDFIGPQNSILWKHNHNKVVEFDGSSEEVFGSYRGRVTLDWKTAELEITELKFEDSGDYELELHINYIIHTSQFKLEVIDKVVKPTISCERNKSNSSDESKNTATLLCSAEPRKPESLMKITWKSQGKFHYGSKLPITLRPENNEVEYICSVSNPLSSESASITAKKCYNDKTSSVSLIVCLSIFFLLFLPGLIGLFFCKWRQKACFAPHDPEKPSATKGKRNRTTEEKPLLDRTETIPSHQRLVQDKDSATDQDQMPPKGMVKDRIGLFNRGINNDEQSLPQRKGSDIYKHEQEDPGFASESREVDSPSLQDPGQHTEPAEKDVIQSEVNDQDRARKSTGSTEENQQPGVKVEAPLQSDHSDSEEKNVQEQADVSDQSSEGEQSGLETAPEQSGLQNNKHEQEDPGFTPVSLSSDSPTQQDPAHNLDIYTSDPDQDQPKEAAEKEVLQSKSTDTEEAKTQDQASDSEEKNVQEQADVSDQSSEGEQSGLETATDQSETEMKTAESPPVQDQDEHTDINKDKSGPDERQTAETKTSHQNTSDLKETQASPEPAASRSDEEMAQEKGSESPRYTPPNQETQKNTCSVS